MGIRIADYLNPNVFLPLLESNLKRKGAASSALQVGTNQIRNGVLKRYASMRRFLEPFVVNGPQFVHKAIEAKDMVLFESAQGTMLDVDFGTYPFVTSSNPVAGGVSIGSGLAPTKIDEVLGVVKAYTTRVGEGPFPTELKDALGETLRQREWNLAPHDRTSLRRCGWFDAVAVRHAVPHYRWIELASLGQAATDVLEGVHPLKIAVGYRVGNGSKVIRRLSYRPPASGGKRHRSTKDAGIRRIRSAEMTRYSQLPVNARRYVKRLEELVGAKMAMISLGRSREETIILDSKFLWKP